MRSRTLAELAELCGARLEGDGARVVRGPAGLAEAGPDEISFLANERYRPELERTRAAAVVVSNELSVGRGELALLRCSDPNSAFTRIVRAFVPEPARPAAGVHPTAWVHPEAQLAADVHVGPCATIGAGARLGAGVVVHANCSIGAGVEIGAQTELHPGVVLYDGVRVGARCLLHAGAVVGSEGFGFEPTAAGWVKIPQAGTVVLEDDVELGANVTIDRARFGATRLCRGVKLDNLVHVAHNVVVGEHSLLIAQVGIAGSSTVGKRSILAGQVGVSGHVRIGDGVRVAAGSGVPKDLADGVTVWGTPAQPRVEAWRQIAAVKRLPDLLTRVARLEKRLEELAAKEGAR